MEIQTYVYWPEQIYYQQLRECDPAYITLILALNVWVKRDCGYKTGLNKTF